MRTMSPVIMPVWVLRPTRLSVVTQYGDGNSQNNINYTSEHVLIFAIAYQTAFSVVGGSLLVNGESRKQQ